MSGFSVRATAPFSNRSRSIRWASVIALAVVGWAWSSDAATNVPTASTTVHDNESFSAGPYLAYIAPFNRGALIPGEDYTESITVDAGSFPARTLFEWMWPDVAAAAGVYDFSAIDFGDYDNTVVPSPVPSRQIPQIRVLSETHDAVFAGQLAGFDVIDDLFLTTRPGDNASNAFEVEVFLHTPKYSADYVRGARPIGVFAGSGMLWTVAVDVAVDHVPDILFMPRDGADIGRGTIDLHAMLMFLVAEGVVPATIWFNGFAFGSETQRGSGSMTLAAFSVSYE